ncbi:PqqD family protein [Ottowia thiooxydans]|uniref:PqqD family protein n=1 Tax=Ottowia thiooxydans TaxID=219182 RepID=A0ABV2QDR8_9BURK
MNLLKFPHSEILFENYEDELVLLDLQGGIYYTLNRSAADCLLILLSAPSADEAIRLIAERFDASEETLKSCIKDMTAQLTGFAVVLPRQQDEPGVSCDIAPGSKLPFTPPLIEQYKDIEDILKFDPVHDVTEGGWPNIRETPAP